jgi:predicted deacylase
MTNKPTWGDIVHVPTVNNLEDPEAKFYYTINQNDISADKRYCDNLTISDYEINKISYSWINIIEDELGIPISIPVMIARGKHEGPVLGLTAAIHGDELQGIPTIHTVFRELKLDLLHGTIIGIPCLNVTGYIRRQRTFSDGVDLNRVMPGNKNGTSSQQYCYGIVEKIIKKFDYLIDFHTASHGKINSYYVRADMKHKVVETMVNSFQPNIIVSNTSKTTLRGIAMRNNIPTICVEIGDSQIFENKLIKKAINGVFNIMNVLNMLKMKLPDDLQVVLPQPVICYRSYWIYTRHGGLLTVHPELGELVDKGQVIASIVNIFGILIAEYKAPEKGIVVGKVENPTSRQGNRILHLGIFWDGTSTDIPENIEEDYD